MVRLTLANRSSPPGRALIGYFIGTMSYFYQGSGLVKVIWVTLDVVFLAIVVGEWGLVERGYEGCGV